MRYCVAGETVALESVVAQIVSDLKKYKTIYLQGEIGAGKTTLVRHIGNELGIRQPLMSPTYAYVHRYRLPDGRCMYHFDVYRIDHHNQVVALGLQDMLDDPESLKIVEWPERLGPYQRPDALKIALHHNPNDPNIRCLSFQYPE